jgi:dipeptidyl aminopeptidase/acylaminoacyl peptidase
MLLIHGSRDVLVPVEQSMELKRRLNRAGVPARLVVVPGKGHWFELDEKQVAEVAEFFRGVFAGRGREHQHGSRE